MNTGNPNIDQHGKHPYCEECGAKVVPQYTNYGVWYQCKNCGHTESHGSIGQVAEP